jgi:hypothetical protein
MELLSINTIRINDKKIAEINQIIQSIYRLVIYSRDHFDDDLLDIYLQGIKHPGQWNEYTEQFFEQEVDRLLVNCKSLYESIFLIGSIRQEQVHRSNLNQ